MRRSINHSVPLTRNMRLLRRAVKLPWNYAGSGVSKTVSRIAIDGNEYALKRATDDPDVWAELALQHNKLLPMSAICKHIAWGEIDDYLYTIQPWGKRPTYTQHGQFRRKWMGRLNDMHRGNVRSFNGVLKQIDFSGGFFGAILHRYKTRMLVTKIRSADDIQHHTHL